MQQRFYVKWPANTVSSKREAYRIANGAEINGRTISVRFKSDAVVAQRVAAHIQRRIEEDDWLPFQSKKEALESLQKLGGIRAQVLRAYDLI